MTVKHIRLSTEENYIRFMVTDSAIYINDSYGYDKRDETEFIVFQTDYGDTIKLRVRKLSCLP